jgi:excinuclease ABC subunit A
MKRIEMNFLPDVYVLCDVCRAARYNRETLAVRYKGKSIADLLNTSVEEALSLLENLPQINQKLQTLLDVGLGYIKLGQSQLPCPVAKRNGIKLAKELFKTGDRPHDLHPRRANNGFAFRRRSQTTRRSATFSVAWQHSDRN